MANEKIIFDKSVISRCEQNDFTDDGTRFYGYTYKGKLPISKATYKDELYLCIRLDYAGFSYNQYKDDYDVIDYYNGVAKAEFDSGFFNKLCEYCYQKYLENNKDIEKPLH